MGTPTARETTVKIGDVVEGRYRIIKLLGQGGMGSVFLAEHLLIKRKVAIKMLHPELANDASVIERFMNEARAAGTLGHPNIVESTDMGFTSEHVPYIVFEYLEGTLLTDEIYRLGGLPVRRASAIGMQIASALNAAHNASIIHRDLKSDNVFLIERDNALDHVKVLDFGISRFLELEDPQRNKVIGTPAFMAPEQITRPDAVDKRADVYALGVIMYEMLTARRPFGSEEDPQALMQRIVNDPPPPLMRHEVPQDLQDLIFNKLLAKDPSQRFTRMSDVEAALEPFTTRRRGAAAPLAPDDERTQLDVARHSGTIPTPAKVRDTPWPGAADTLDTPGMASRVQMGSMAPPRRPYGLYMVAGAGIVLGGLGLVIGLHGGDDDKPVTATATTLTPQNRPGAATPAPRDNQIQKVQIDLDADAPNAHVVFRRRIAPAPSTMQVMPTDVVELVEVSAPGYKTERFWLTFDRPTHLKAHMVKGNGSMEATEEDTLIALGEVSGPTQEVAQAAPAVTMPATVAPTPATPAPAATTPAAAKAATLAINMTRKPAAPERPIQSVTTPISAPTHETAPAAAPAAPTPRRVGRGAADATTIARADHETTSQPALAVEAPLPMPELPQVAKEPKPEPAHADEPKPEPAHTDEAKAEPAKPMPAADPAVAKSASIDAGTVSSVVGTHRPEVLKCFAEGKKKDHTMKGTISLQLLVDAAGHVKRVQVQSTLNSPTVAGCIVKSANAWKFPSRANGDLATVAYPFTIN